MTLDVGMLLLYASPVAIAAIGELIYQRSGQLNIGLEGMMLAGAFCAVVATEASGSPWLGVGAAVAAALVLMAVQSVFTLRLRQDQVIVGTAINLLALGATSAVYRMRYGTSGRLIDVAALPSWHGVNALVVALLVATPLAWWLLHRTAWGLAIRSVGEYPEAAQSQGFSVSGLRWQAALLPALLAGMAGAQLSIGLAGSFAENMTQGRGFVALAMVSFGRWRAVGVLGACLAVGYAETLRFQLQASGAKVPFQLLLALPYLLALGVLVAVGKGTRAPAALGKTMDA